MVNKDKTVGIMTFHRSHNCGSILQSFAMQEVLADRGYSSEFIDFSTKGQKDLYSVFKPLKARSLQEFAQSIYRNLFAIALLGRSKQNWKSYDAYIARYLNVSSKSFGENAELVESELGYSKYLTGSDQVWNVTIADYDKAYFLNFVEKQPKIAYAVSQGAKDINKYATDPQEIAELIRKIDYVSTREENGQKWLKSLTGDEYTVVLDPTLLHAEERYARIEEKHEIPGITNDNFIFVYATPLSREFMELVNRFAKENGLKVVVWHNNIWLKRLGWFKGVKSPRHQTPGKYLDLIKNAKYICTSSFHGVAFSTIYRKDFVVLENDGMRAGDDDRMTGFLKRLKLSDRIVNEAAFDSKMNEVIDYTEFEVELKKNQKVSRDFLDKALKD